MVADIVRTGAGLLTTPVLMAARAMQRSQTGSRCVLDVTIERLPDVVSRQRFLERLLRAGQDPAVEGVLLRIDGPPGGWAATSDLRAVLETLRAGGTRLTAHLEAPGNAAMALASACDDVLLVPTAEVGLLGVGAELTFFGGALERLGITPDFEAAGAYKSFGEAWTRSYASLENQEAVLALVDDLQRQLLQTLAAGRGLDVQVVLDALAEAPLPAGRALELGLVDGLAYDDEVRHHLKGVLGEGVRLVDFDRWARADFAIDRLERVPRGGAAVAVVALDGPIVMEEGGRGTAVRARKVVEVLRKLRKDDDVAAVVLHVNSPGGSALASDLMWREVDLLRADKPVVAAFEDVAASGGFYLAAPCQEILVRPGTLTGSIGVFGGKLVVGPGLRRVGVTTQPLGGGPNAHVFSPSRPFDEGQRRRFRASLQRFYDGFVTRVAEGRGRPVDEVEPHCRGRVWTGVDALQHGLVDGFGTLADAVERARILAALPEDVRRIDVSTLPRRSAVQWAAQKLAPALTRAALPSAGVAVLDALGLHLGPALEVVATHPGQPLAMMPWELRP